MGDLASPCACSCSRSYFSLGCRPTQAIQATLAEVAFRIVSPAPTSAASLDADVSSNSSSHNT